MRRSMVKCRLIGLIYSSISLCLKHICSLIIFNYKYQSIACVKSNIFLPITISPNDNCEDTNNTIIAEIRAFVLLRYFYTNEET